MQRSIRFGVATADHQCEAYDGRDDIRDVWERVRGVTPRGRATDFWNRYREDVDLARKLGCTAFRLSLSWARLEPQPGQWDDAAFDHYRDVLQYMRDAGMMTVVTLHHNTWPLHVQAAGGGAGMLDAEFPDRMAAYAQEAGRRLGTLIDRYVTINEPNQLVYGYIKGFWMRDYPMPPGLPPFASGEQQMDAVLKLIPNLFRAHARMRAAIQKQHPDAKVGANPLILGIPRWLQHIVDRNATHLKTPEHAMLQARRLQQRSLIDSGIVDVSLAQLTMTHERMDHVLFSEPYCVAHPAALHANASPLPQSFDAWKGRVGVLTSAPMAVQAGGYFPDAAISYYSDAQHACDALKRGEIDLVFDDDVILQQYAADGLVLAPIRGPDQPFCVAVALGSHALLDAVDRALRTFKTDRPQMPQTLNRKNVADIGRAPVVLGEVPDFDASLQRIRKRGVLRAGICPGVAGLCMRDGKGGYEGLEPDLARAIAREISGPNARVDFVELDRAKRVNALRSPLRAFDKLRKSFAMFGTLVGTNWWNLGLAGKLPAFLCPSEAVGALDFVGLDYYWGVPVLWPREMERLMSAAQAQYGKAPVWPNELQAILEEAQEQFPGKPIVVIENGCVTNADGYTRARYLEAHIKQVDRALEKGLPIEAYLCWSITSNREWGLHFDDNSDFGLYHIDLDTDPALKRSPTDAASTYARIIGEHTAR
jgi:beta-glucosidase/6-phospho-beta-glucosidase/beta-galactosidase/ABC-type amino acid transport substrate-binding protein